MKIQFGPLMIARGSSFKEVPINLHLIRLGFIQDIACIGAHSMVKADKGNQQHALRFQIVKRHKTFDDAAAHALLYSSYMPHEKNHLLFLNETNDEIFFLTSAALKRLETRIKGILTHHFYEFVGGHFQKTGGEQ